MEKLVWWKHVTEVSSQLQIQLLHRHLATSLQPLVQLPWVMNLHKNVLNQKTTASPDNVDKNVAPWNTTSNCQTKSLRYVHMYGVGNRVNIDHLSDDPPKKNALIPSTEVWRWSFHPNMTIKPWQHIKFQHNFGKGDS